MKKWISTFLMVVFSIASVAQEVAEVAGEEMPEKGNWFSVASRWTMVYVFAAVIILLVLRTFRNKAEI